MTHLSHVNIKHTDTNKRLLLINLIKNVMTFNMPHLKSLQINHTIQQTTSTEPKTQNQPNSLSLFIYFIFFLFFFADEIDFPIAAV